MNTPDEALIEQYFQNALSGEALRVFEQRLQSDEAFAEAVRLHAAALQAIQLEGSAALRARLRERGRQLDNTARNRRPWLWLLGILLALASVSGWWFSRSSEADPAKPVQNIPIETQQPDTFSIPTTPVETPKAPEEPIEKKLFAAHFKPYRDPSIEPARRGAENLSPSEQFQALYWNGRYREALQAFNNLSAATQTNDNLRFLKANCLLEQGKPGEAEGLLISVLENNQTRFYDQVAWYLALAHLGNDHNQAARLQLQKIAADARSPRQADARQLLRQLK